MTEGDRALVHLAHTHGVSHIARTLGITRHLAQKRVDEAKKRVTKALWLDGKNTPESFYFTDTTNGMEACATAALRTPSDAPRYTPHTTDKAD